MKKSNIATLIVFFLLIPVTLFFGSKLPGRGYYITGTAIIIELMIPFFMAFEGRRPQARELVVIAVMCAIAIAGRAAIPIPNFKAIFAIIMLSGIAVNSSIILVDRINQIKENYTHLTDAIIVAAGQRIRPIMMTSLTTILSLLPMAITFGEGASLRAPMAIAVIGGLITSTLLSLVVIPCVYYILEKMKKRVMG